MVASSGGCRQTLMPRRAGRFGGACRSLSGCPFAGARVLKRMHLLFLFWHASAVRRSSGIVQTFSMIRRSSDLAAMFSAAEWSCVFVETCSLGFLPSSRVRSLTEHFPRRGHSVILETFAALRRKFACGGIVFDIRRRFGRVQTFRLRRGPAFFLRRVQMFRLRQRGVPPG